LWDRLHGFWGKLPNYRPIGVSNVTSDQNYTGKAAEIFAMGHGKHADTTSLDDDSEEEDNNDEEDREDGENSKCRDSEGMGSDAPGSGLDDMGDVCEAGSGDCSEAPDSQDNKVRNPSSFCCIRSLTSLILHQLDLDFSDDFSVPKTPAHASPRLARKRKTDEGESSTSNLPKAMKKMKKEIPAENCKKINVNLKKEKCHGGSGSGGKSNVKTKKCNHHDEFNVMQHEELANFKEERQQKHERTMKQLEIQCLKVQAQSECAAADRAQSEQQNKLMEMMMQMTGMGGTPSQGVPSFNMGQMSMSSPGFSPFISPLNDETNAGGKP
jgi:hypothetical protein